MRNQHVEERVGYKRPPHHSRFKPGNKEHLKRKKRKQKQQTNVFSQIMNGRVSFRDGDLQKSERRMDLAIKNLARLAMKGDVSAADSLIKTHAQFELVGDINPVFIQITEADLRI